MKQKYKDINFSKTIKFDEKFDQYTVQMKRKPNYWWLLLLLLPLLLLIKCERDVNVHCFEPSSKASLEGVKVDMSYQSHYLFDDGIFLRSDSIQMTENTDSTGTAYFKDCPCSVFSYIFYALSKADFVAKNGCHGADDISCIFHYTWNVDIPMEPRREDLFIKVVDDETGDILTDATLVYSYFELEEEKVDSAKTDAAGIAMLPHMRYCESIDRITGSCYGYADSTYHNLQCMDYIVPEDSLAIRLRPIKERFVFFVKDKETKEPIASAQCSVSLTRPSGSVDGPRTVTTSVDGKGSAAYEDAFVLSTIAIDASKLHYKDGSLEGGPYSVEEFIKLDEETRTIWLEPEPYKEDFIDVDSLTGKPIANVKNVITVTDPGGEVHEFTEISNSNGVFPVTAKENAKIVIKSSCPPAYKDKCVVIEHFKEGQKIKMEPNMVAMKFRTVKDVAGHPLLSNCSLSVIGSVSGNLQPKNSGNGEFQVSARYTENLSINASHSGYASNSSTVNNSPVVKLMNSITDIPLKEDPVVYNHSDSQQGSQRNCFDLHEPCRFSFTWSTCNACTYLLVTDGNGAEIARFGHNDPGGGGNGISYSPPSGTTTLQSKTGNICVTSFNVNGHLCTYTIKKL